MDILAVIDMQNDFIYGPLGTEEARQIIGRAAEKIRSYENSGNPVIFTADTHTEGYLQTSEGRNLPVVHCVEGTAGWEIPALLSKSGGIEHRIIQKPCFGSLELPGVIRDIAGVQTELRIEFIGVCTDICVISNVLITKAHFPDAYISVDAACCAGVTPDTHRMALEIMKLNHIKTASVKGVVSKN